MAEPGIGNGQSSRNARESAAGEVLRYGITVPNSGTFFDIRALGELAHEAEEVGWDGFFVWDHVYFGFFPTADPWMALTAIALRTRHVRLVPLVTPLPRCRPVKLAREAVTLDHLSDGRVILGVGIGAFRWEWDDLGEVAELALRGEMLDEGLAVLLEIWSGRPVTHEGKHYHVHIQELPGWAEAGHFEPRPLQQPHIPIWVAGVWPNKKPFRRAARWQGVVPLKAGVEFGEMMTPADIAEIARYVHGHREQDGHFDVVAGGHTSGTDRAYDAEIVAAYEVAGATWWLESVSPWDFGWQWQGPWPEDEMRRRIRAGPPRP